MPKLRFVATLRESLLSHPHNAHCGYRLSEQRYVRHRQFAQPKRIVTNSKTSQGVIFKPEEGSR